ncbi:MAG: DUF2177 family protein [Chloroflexi bacterium]|nr:DUF2177 family protein [Chloroflexota bacterium]
MGDRRGRPSVARTAATGAVLGVAAYGTYDLTNQATLNGGTSASPWSTSPGAVR